MNWGYLTWESARTQSIICQSYCRLLIRNRYFLIQKSSIAVAILVLGILLTYINFEPNQKQSEETLVALKNIMALIPSAGIALSIFLMYFYPITSGYHKNLLKIIEERKNG